MKISTRARYAVMAMVDLAQYNGEFTASTLTAISERQGLSLAYLEQIFLKLRRGGMVVSVRGPGGGYLLSKKSEETYIYDIIKAVEVPIRATRCKGGAHVGCQTAGAQCMTHSLWAGLEEVVEKFLKNTSLSDVLHRTTYGLELFNLEKPKKPYSYAGVRVY